MEKCKQLTVLVLLTFSITINSGRGVSVKHPELPEYQLDTNYSLIPPFANVYSVQNWIFRESSTTNGNRISLTLPAAHNSRGSVWNKWPVESNDWQIEMVYTSYSDKETIADGMAVWYVPHISCSSGYHDSYGGPGPQFIGLMIAIDTYLAKFAAKEALNRVLEESAIVVVNNEKPRIYNITSEGHDIMSGRCIVRNRYRNDSETFSTLKVKYENNVLTVSHKQGDKPFEVCTEVKNITLATRGHFGISATTGGIYGSFDIHEFKYYGHVDVRRAIAALESKTDSITISIDVLVVVIAAHIVFIIGIATIFGLKFYRDKQTRIGYCSGPCESNSLYENTIL